MGTLIAEDLLLLPLDDEKGTTSVPTVLGGAVLMELALIGAMTTGDKPNRWTEAKVRVDDRAAAADPVLRRLGLFPHTHLACTQSGPQTGPATRPHRGPGERQPAR